MRVAQPIEWTPEGVVMIDQRLLPAELVRHTYTSYEDVAAAIRDMVIRGAPAIGVAAGMGAALGVLHSPANSISRSVSSARRPATDQMKIFQIQSHRRY